MLSGQDKAAEGELPILIYNPHPFSIRAAIECEVQPTEIVYATGKMRVAEIKDEDGNSRICQLEKETCNLGVDWRKKVVFEGELKPGQMNRFSCYLREVDIPPGVERPERTKVTVASEFSEVVFDAQSGQLERYRVNGFDFIAKGGVRLLVIDDNADPWGMTVSSFNEVIGTFAPMSPGEAAAFAAVPAKNLQPLRIIEDGPVRTVVETLMQYGNSAICLRYKVSKLDAEIEIEVRALWNEKDTMLKLAVPTVLADGKIVGQVAYGVEEFTRAEEELVAQQWIAACAPEANKALTIINDGTYGFDYRRSELRLSLLRSPAYAGHPSDGALKMRDDRFEPRIDQGERVFKFWLNAGDADTLLKTIDRIASLKNQAPMVLSCFPSGRGEAASPSVILSDERVCVTALKKAEHQNWLVLRLFEPTGEDAETLVTLPHLDVAFEVALSGFELKSYAVDHKTKEVFEIDLLERRIAHS